MKKILKIQEYFDDLENKKQNEDLEISSNSSEDLEISSDSDYDYNNKSNYLKDSYINYMDNIKKYYSFPWGDENENENDDNSDSMEYYSLEDIEYFINIKNEPELFEKEIIGNISIDNDDTTGIVVSPLNDVYDLNYNSFSDKELPYILALNLMKGKWEISRFSFSLPNNVYVLEHENFRNILEKESSNCFIQVDRSVKTISNNIGFYTFGKNNPPCFNYDFSIGPDDEYKIWDEDLTINRKDCPFFNLPISVIQTEASKCRTCQVIIVL